jgi:hypothetical protein
LPSPEKFPIPRVAEVVAHAGLLDIVVGEVIVEAIGIVGNGLGAIVPTTGNTFGTGTAGVELTPRLLISNDPNGIPVRSTPPGTVGVIDAGLDDAAMLFEPEPHIPDIPAVSSVPEDIGVDIPEDADIPGIAMVPGSTALAGVEAPTAVPPPSKLADDPNISEGGVATVGHAVLPAVVGIVIVSVTPVGAGLTPADVISVEPSGIPVPVGVPDEPIAMPSGVVAPIVGVGATVSSIWAAATLQNNNAGRAATTNKNFLDLLRLLTASPR